MQFLPTGTPNRGQAFSPTIASQVRPGGSLAFSEPMTFDPSAGGWICESQIKSMGAFSPGTKESGNGNLRLSPDRARGNFSKIADKMLSPEKPNEWKSAIKLGPTERLINQYQQDNPFTFPAYWAPDANSRGWYDKPGETIPIGNTQFGRRL